jgi:hypothetical protein
MISHEQTRELVLMINQMITLAESNSLYYSDLETARKLIFRVETENAKPVTEEEIKDDIKENAHFFGGWDEFKKVVAQLEENDNEAAWERRMTDY